MAQAARGGLFTVVKRVIYGATHPLAVMLLSLVMSCLCDVWVAESLICGLSVCAGQDVGVHVAGL
jgi:hypothetical protein